MTTLTIQPSTTEWNIRDSKKEYGTEGEEGSGRGRGREMDGDEDEERREMVRQLLSPFARPAGFLCFHFRASPRPPRAQTYLKLPQMLHKPDNTVIDILFIIILFFHKLLAPH